jgi:5-methylcytosine-specific restriction endonuclease McrA
MSIISLEARLEANRDQVHALCDAIKEELAGKACVDCGERDQRTLDFDHVWGVKLFPISDAIRKMVSLQELKLEIAKCRIRCRNCHLKEHDYGNGEHYYTSKPAIDRAIAKVERLVVQAYLREQAKALAKESPREKAKAVSEEPSVAKGPSKVTAIR